MTSKSSPHAEFEQISPTAYRVRVTVAAGEFKSTLDSAYAELSKSANIPGFRPGKAPRAIINVHYGKEKILHDTYEDVIHETLGPVLREKELTLVGPPRVDHDEWKDGEGFRYVATFEVVPPIPAVDYEEIGATLPEREVTQEVIEEELRRLRMRFGQASEIKDRPVQKGDFALIRFEAEVPEVSMESIEGEKPWKVVEDLMEVEVGSGKGVEGLEDQLVGMELEEIKEFDLNLPDNFPDPLVRGKSAKARVRMIGIRDIKQAELTDEFIKEKFGEQDIGNLEALKERIKTEVQSNWSSADDRLKIDQIEWHFNREFDFPLPAGLVRVKYADILDRTMDALNRSGADIEKLMEKGSGTGERIRKRARYQAERMVRLDLVMREIARKESIGVANEEVANYLAIMAMRQRVPEKDLRTFMRDPQFIENTRDEILNKKVTHFLLEKVKSKTVTEQQFKTLMEEAREQQQAIEKRFMEKTGDPETEFAGDYLKPELDKTSLTKGDGGEETSGAGGSETEEESIKPSEQ